MSPAALKTMREEVKQYIDDADEKTIRIVRAMLEAAEEAGEDDKAFWDEMDRRTKEYENGEITPLTLDQFNEAVTEYIRTKKSEGK